MRIQSCLPVASLLLLLATSSNSIRADVVARWTLNNDTTGLQNLGADGVTSNLVIPAPEASIAGGPTFSTAGGASGGYATFDGNQALVATMAGNAVDDLIGYPFTLSAWIRPAANIGRSAAVGIINGAAADQYYTMGIETPAEGSDLQAVRRNPAFIATEGLGTNATLFNGNWHHVAVVNASNTNSRLYLDGVQVGQSTTSVTLAAGVNAIGIGAVRRSAGFIDKYSGDIDEVQIYNDALVGSQIQFLFQNPGLPALPLVAGDVDLDGDVDVADLQIIADNFLDSVAERTEGDLIPDGIVDFQDYREWKSRASAEVLAAAAGVFVPEPSAAAIAIVGLTIMGLNCRKRRCSLPTYC